LTTVAVRTSHVFKLRAGERSNSPESGPCELRCFSDDWVAFGIASVYESLMEDTLMRGACISRSRRGGGMARRSSRCLTLKDEPAPRIGATPHEVFGNHR